jgi:hypothetical protein
MAFCWMMTVFILTGSEQYLYGRANGFHGVIAVSVCLCESSHWEREGVSGVELSSTLTHEDIWPARMCVVQ